MSATGADRFDRSEYSGKHLTVAANFHSGLDDVANTGDARFFARTNHSQRCFGDSPDRAGPFPPTLVDRPRAFPRDSQTFDPNGSG